MVKDNWINGKTQILAVIGDPVSHSLSPIMHNAVYNFLAMDSIYIAYHVHPTELTNAVHAIKALNLKGVNITIPHKQTIKSLLDEITGDSLNTGSVNTIIHHNGRTIGTSTDGIGFIRSLREDGNFDPSRKKIVLLGAGGTALAIAYRLIQSGVSALLCVNRSLSNAEKIKTILWESTGFEVGITPLSQLQTVDLSKFDLLINTTSLELSEDLSIVPKDMLTPDIFVYDTVYKKQGTRLLKEAQETGCRVLDGLSLLVYQGAESFRLWFDREAPINIMKKALQDYCGEN